MNTTEYINQCYDALTGNLGEQAKNMLDDNEEMTPDECVRQAIYEGLEYYEDQAVTIGHALVAGFAKMGETTFWEDIDTMLYDDVYSEMSELRDADPNSR